MLSGIPLSFMSWIYSYLFYSLCPCYACIINILQHCYEKIIAILHEIPLKYSAVCSIASYCTCISQKSRYSECSV